MISLADIVQQHQAALLQRYEQQLLPGHHRALQAIGDCRTGAYGETLWQCDHCCDTVRVPLSCGHRSCPRCQHHETTHWLDRQRDKLLPVNYFLLTFTLPAQLRPLAWHHQRQVFDALFKAVSGTLKQFARRSEHLGGQAGMTLVLHTHNRQLDFHPHIHVVMPGGVITEKHQAFKTIKGRYLFNARALAKVFRAKCLQAFANAQLSLPPRVPDQWVAHCQFAGHGEPALRYLARYLYRGVMSESNINHANHGQVNFRYQDSRTKTWKQRTLDGADFLWKILNHVLPRGYQRVRHYGFLHHNAQCLLKRIQCLLHVDTASIAPTQKPVFHCRCGHGTMTLVAIRRCHPVDHLASARASPMPKT